MTYKNKTFVILIIFFIIILIIDCNKTNNQTQDNNTSEENQTQDIIEIINPLETVKKEYNLGNVQTTDKKKTLSYKLINKTSEALIVYYALTDCGCTIAILEDEKGNKSEEFGERSIGKVADIELNNGESMLIHVELDFSEEPLGDGSKIINVFNDYDDLIAEIEVFYFIES